MYTDGNGFPLTVKPSHLFGSTERMDTAEILSAIVEQACLYSPEKFVGASNSKRSEGGTFQTFEKDLPNEALSAVAKVYPKEAFSEVKKVPAASVASDLVRNEIVLN